MTRSIELSPLLPGHIPAIAAAERQCFSDPWSENLLRQELQNPLSRWFVLLLGGQVAGYAATLHICGEVHITNIAVLPPYRRQGLGRALMAAAVEYARGLGAFCMTLEVRAGNAPAIALYRAFGFETVGRRPRYYQDPEEDACLMTKTLSEEPL